MFFKRRQSKVITSDGQVTSSSVADVPGASARSGAAAQSVSPAKGSADDMIDYRKLVAAYSFSEHSARADAYFSKLDLNSGVARKPFASAHEAGHICAGLAAILPNLHLFPGAKVLDFGAGTCWMARTLAMLGCEVTAVDVSRKALDVGERLIRSDALADQLNVEFVALSGEELPFPDEHFDRVICFDALHHVPDQHVAIREFARVLKPGGIAAMHEPGPNHSRSPQSQHEMRTFAVIEADVHVDKLIDTALAAGFSNAQLAIFGSMPVMTTLAGFDQFLANPQQSEAGVRLNAHIAAEILHRRTFVLSKGDPLAHMDSRTFSGLHGTLELTAHRTDTHTVVRGQITNSGSVIWLPSFSGLGGVNLGVHLFASDGRMLDHDYGRFAVSQDKVMRMDNRHLAFEIPHPPELEEFELVIDLVSEGVGWFEVGGTKPVRIRVDKASLAQVLHRE